MTSAQPVRTLYLCYFGLREPLVQTQVLPYLRQLIAGGEVEVFLLTFEPNRKQAWTASDEADWRARLAGDGIRWFSLPYHKRPSVIVTPYDIMCGAWKALRLARARRQINLRPPRRAKSVVAAQPGPVCVCRPRHAHD